jgi:hypothetical protein
MENRNDNQETPEIIETVITYVSSDLLAFNEALKEELDRAFGSDVYSEAIDLLVKYKPTTNEEMQKVPNLSRSFIASKGAKASQIINAMVNKFVQKYEQMTLIDVDTRKAMENVLLRNSHVSEKNSLLSIDKLNLLGKKDIDGFSLEEFMDGLLSGEEAIYED